MGLEGDPGIGGEESTQPYENHVVYRPYDSG